MYTKFFYKILYICVLVKKWQLDWGTEFGLFEAEMWKRCTFLLLSIQCTYDRQKQLPNLAYYVKYASGAYFCPSVIDQRIHLV